MTNGSWKNLEGTLLDGKYFLERCLSTEDEKAVFLTVLAGSEPRPAAIKVICHENQAACLERWNTAAELSHPNLVGIYAVGQTDLEGAPVAYAVMEYADDNLARVLQERPLSEPEAVEALGGMLRALGWLHSRGLVHSRMKPSNVMAVGDTVKISSDGICRPGEAAEGAQEFAAPETAAGEISPAADVWSVGVTLFEMLTQRLPRIDLASGILAEEVSLEMPARFLEIVRHCVCLRPEERWTVPEIEAAVAADGLPVSETPAMPPPAPEPIRESAPESVRKPAPEPIRQPAPEPIRQPALEEDPKPARKPVRWIYGAIAGGVLVGVLLLRKPADPPLKAEIAPVQAPVAAPAPPKPSPVVEPAPRVPAVKAPAPSQGASGTENRGTVAAQAPPAVAASSRPSPTTPRSGSANRTDRAIWRVVVYTYTGVRDAEKKAKEINRTSPGLHAEVFLVNGDNPPYLVTIGGRMARPEALIMQRKAREAGLPRDAYVQNYSH